MKNTRRSSDRPAAALASESSAPSMPSDPSSGSETVDTGRCIQSAPELAAQPTVDSRQSAVDPRQPTSTPPSIEPGT